MLKKDDPIYYKVELEKLLKQAKDNGLEVVLVEPKVTIGGSMTLMFKSDNGECAGVKVKYE